MGLTGVLASIGSFVVEISIQRRICELPGSSLVEEEPSIGVGSPLVRAIDRGDTCFARGREDRLGKRLGELTWDR